VPALRLRSIAGGRRGQEFTFSGPRVRIGRSRDNDLILPDREHPSTSSHHAEALLDATGSWWIVDASSANGTRLNDVLIGRHVLTGGDRLAFGDEQFSVSIAGSSSARWWIGGTLLAIVLAALAAFVLLARPVRQPSFEPVAAAASKSIFLVALEDNGTRGPVGTGFAIADGTGRADVVLVTNAHIGAMLEGRTSAAGEPGARAVAVQGDTYVSRRIVAVSLHPRWRTGSIENDVALLDLEPGAPIHPLELASDEELAQLTRGTPVAAFGFPAVSTDASSPRPRLSADVVGDVRGDYLEVGLGVSPGTSGSPVFDLSGAVVGIVAGGDFVASAGGPPKPSGSQVNWALGVKVIRGLLALRR